MATKRNKKCKRRTTKKYLIRKSPSFSAMDCKGSIKKGNDGRRYISKPFRSNNIYRWVPL